MIEFSDNAIMAILLKSPQEIVPVLQTTKCVASLSSAAELAGCHIEEDWIVPHLIDLLGNQSAIVREGALYGLSYHYSDNRVAPALRRLLDTETSRAVTIEAESILEECV